MVNKLPLKIVVIGCTPLANRVINLLEKMSNLLGVVNLHPELGMHKANYDYLGDFASRRSSDLYWTKDINDYETVAWITSKQPDLIIQCGWSQIFKKKILSIPRLFSIGIHPSPLPIGRGAAILNWKLIEGGGVWGNSLFIMEPKTDSGPILDQQQFFLEPRDDIRSAHIKVDRTAIQMLKRTLPVIHDGTFKTVHQDNSLATRYYKRSPQDGLMEFTWSADKILNFIRALTHPFPGAFFDTSQGKLIVWQAIKDTFTSDEIPGTIIEISNGKGVLIQVGKKERVWLTMTTPNNDVETWCDIWADQKQLKSYGFIV